MIKNKFIVLQVIFILFFLFFEGCSKMTEKEAVDKFYQIETKLSINDVIDDNEYINLTNELIELVDDYFPNDNYKKAVSYAYRASGYFLVNDFKNSKQNMQKCYKYNNSNICLETLIKIAYSELDDSIKKETINKKYFDKIDYLLKIFKSNPNEQIILYAYKINGFIFNKNYIKAIKTIKLINNLEISDPKLYEIYLNIIVALIDNIDSNKEIQNLSYEILKDAYQKFLNNIPFCFTTDERNSLCNYFEKQILSYNQQKKSLNKYKNYFSNKPITLFVLDGSSSMYLPDNGVHKIDIAKSVIKNIINKIDTDKTNIGLVGFNKDCNKNYNDLNNIDLLVAPNNNDKNKIYRKLDKFFPAGGTPLAKAIKSIKTILKDTKHYTRVVLISDGEESCSKGYSDEYNNITPCDAIKELKESGIDVEVYPIGYNIQNNPEARQQLQCIADTFGTELSLANNTQDLQKIINKVTLPLDTDKDGIPDDRDQCPNTPKNFEVDSNGCEVAFDFNIEFEDNSEVIEKRYYNNIKVLADYLKTHPQINKVRIKSYSNYYNSDEDNKKLAKKRANEIINLLVNKYKINKSILYYGVNNTNKTVATLNANLYPPILKIVSIDTNTTKNSSQIELKITDMGLGIGKVIFYLDNTRVNPLKTSERKVFNDLFQRYTLGVPTGKHKIRVFAYDASNTYKSNEEKREVASSFEEQPSLHVLSVGINEFDYLSGRDQLKHASNDAKLISIKLNPKKQRTFKDIYVYTLNTTKNTYKKDIISAFKNLRSKKNISPNDYFVFFISTHGLVKKDNNNTIKTFYLFAKDSKKLPKIRNALEQYEIIEKLIDVPTIFRFSLFDACYSGNIVKTMQNLIDKKFKLGKDEGIAFIAATQPTQKARELDEYQHGYFTYLLSKAFSKEADIDNDNLISNLEVINYITQPNLQTEEQNVTFYVNTSNKRFDILSLDKKMHKLKPNIYNDKELKEFNDALKNRDITTLNRLKEQNSKKIYPNLKFKQNCRIKEDYTFEEIKESLLNKDKRAVNVSIHFKYDSDKILVKSKKLLELVAKVLNSKEFNSIRINIVGHTDNKGSDDYNYDLSLRRAKAVKQYLVFLGVDKNRLEIEGRGKLEPIAPNDSAECRAKNRRVEFMYLGN